VWRLRAIIGLLVFSLPARGEETVRRQMVDAGVHVPVLTRQPAVLEAVEAEYPPEAQSAGLEAVVVLTITLGADGSVTEARVSQPVGNGFDEAAIAAVKRYRFSPAEVDGAPAAIQMLYQVRFVLAVADAGVPDAGAEPPVARATLKGTLVARGSRTRIGSGTVQCIDQTDAGEAVTDERGLFSLRAYAGHCQGVAMAAGFETFNAEETLAPDETTEVIYYLIPKAVGFETVVRAKRDKKEVVRRTLERQELQKVPGSFGDPVRVIQNFPGVARAPFLLGQLIVRGAAPAQTLTYLDGVEIPLLFHLGAGPSVVNGEFLDKVDFFPGGFGSRYGRAVGGVVDVTTRQGASDTYHGVAKVDLQDSSLFFEMPLTEGVSVAAAARRSYIDVLLPLVLPKDPEGGSLLVLPTYWDYQVRLDAGASKGKPPARNSYSLMAFGSDDLLKIIATGGGRNRDITLDIHTRFHRLVGNGVFRRGKSSYKVTPYLGYDNATFAFGTTTLKADTYAVGLRADYSLEVNKWFALRAGTDTRWDHIAGVADLPVFSGTQYVSFPGAQPVAEMQHIERQLNALDLALYAEVDFKIGKLTLTPGIRGSFAHVHGQRRWAADPRFWAALDISDWTQLKASVGLYTQPPAAVNLEPTPFGTPSLVHEKAFQASLGVVQKLTENINIDLTGYFNRRFDNVVQPGPRVVNADGSVTVERYANTGLGRAYGLEVMLKHEVTERFFGWISYTLNRSEERRAGSGDPYVLTAFDQTHILVLVGSYRIGKGWEVGSRFRYVTGNPKTPVVHEYDLYQADSNRFTAQFGDFRSSRVKPFHQLDLRIDKAFVFKLWTFSVFLDIQNVYNAQNVEASLFDYRFRQEFEVPGIPFLPILGVKGSF
jgi:TonB family protein